ncbi:exodeoxyribonuclease V subunit alpha [Enterobacteriaceae endosymbiont of Neohaemonia nigricornis]|uniref:exodeoxyribonuclease V subunit alpha n=1 Tax=Enterobacteriaceae endosymbiont of Neohaemonia nigricornis TaxID=2675792 RepID=UPI001449B4C3|nr:exodeoxyribonuclease V subunit alpha [Enterobacteriaceae endosymbiont of Neohaemonia nigricornis]QJC30580.1 exodeoxyribonuclease V subunit alpha [Enterobacteriaceae endosymbiont of Neohaemonia nigricornis]
MFNILNILYKSKIFKEIDLQFANIMSDITQPELILAIAYLNKMMRRGHVCLPIKKLNLNKIFHNKKVFLEKYTNIIKLNSIEDWEKKLLSYPQVNTGKYITPFIIYNKCLYIYKMWQAENIIVKHFIKNKFNNTMINIDSIIPILNLIFNEQDIIQKQIALMSITHRISIITGSPGTGKTSIISKLILFFIKCFTKSFKIKVATPTGKASHRLTESLSIFFNSIDIIPLLNNQEKNNIPKNAVTIHNLLKINMYNQTTIFNKKNPLNVNLLIIDEASMIDLHLMTIILESLSHDSFLILLGDNFQLSPIEPGYVFQDLCYFMKFSKTIKYNIWLSTILKISYVYHKSSIQYYLKNCIFSLKNNYRYKITSGIHQLAISIKYNQKHIIKDILLNNKYNNIIYNNILNIKDYEFMIKNLIIQFKNYLYFLKKNIKNIDFHNLFQELKKYQILCVLQNGLFGTKTINNRLETEFFNQNLILHYNAFETEWYLGRPIIIKQNNNFLNLFNGDIGITIWNDEKKKFQIIFPLNNIIDIVNLPPYDIAYAITVHKSQGSEFTNISLILPDKFSHLLNKELIYTAVTRTKNKLYIYSPNNILFKAIEHNIKKYSNIIYKLLI